MENVWLVVYIASLFSYLSGLYFTRTGEIILCTWTSILATSLWPRTPWVHEPGPRSARPMEHQNPIRWRIPNASSALKSGCRLQCKISIFNLKNFVRWKNSVKNLNFFLNFRKFIISIYKKDPIFPKIGACWGLWTPIFNKMKKEDEKRPQCAHNRAF